MVLSLISVHHLLSTPFFTTGLEGFLALVAMISLVYVVSAESMSLTLSLTPPEPYEGMARLFSVEASRLKARLANVAVYSLTLALLSPSILVAMGFGGLALTLASALSSQILSVLFTLRDSMSRLGFANGDVAGFSYELTRVSSLTLLAVVLGWYLRV
jgi:cobalamin synthase